MKNLETLEVDLRLKIKSNKLHRGYVSKHETIEEVIPHDLDDLLEIVKANPKEFHFLVDDIRQHTNIFLQYKIGMR